MLTPQLLLTPQATPSFAAYPVTSAAQHTTSIQQVLQHHVRQSSILQSTIQQVLRVRIDIFYFAFFLDQSH